MSVSRGSTERKEVGKPTSVDVLVGHAEVILAGLLTATNPLHAVLPPLDVAFEEDPSVAEKIVLGKVGRVFGVGTRLVHTHETLRKVNVPCPFAVGRRGDVSGEGHYGQTHATYAGMFCCGPFIIVIGEMDVRWFWMKSREERV